MCEAFAEYHINLLPVVEIPTWLFSIVAAVATFAAIQEGRLFLVFLRSN